MGFPVIKIFQKLLRLKKMPPHLRTGIWGEKVAAKMLRKKGYRIIGQRVRIGKKDELDLVVRTGDTLVFVEVKTRKSEEFGPPSAAVTPAKKRYISRAAVRYIGRLHKHPEYVRFDIIEVIGEENGKPPCIRHLENAFTLDKHYHLTWGLPQTRS